MVFSYAVTTPINTPEATPLKTTINITHGVIHRWQIYFPPGLWGQCGLRIEKGSEYILPTNPEAKILGDNFVFQGEDFIYISDHPFVLDVFSWNTDTEYPHTIYIHVFMKPLWTYFQNSNKMYELLETFEQRYGV